jgi:hypothetical protein
MEKDTLKHGFYSNTINMLYSQLLFQLNTDFTIIDNMSLLKINFFVLSVADLKTQFLRKTLVFAQNVEQTIEKHRIVH